MRDATQDPEPPDRFVTAGRAAVIHADLDGDGTLDIALLDPEGGRVHVWLGTHTAGYSPEGGQRSHGAAPVERLTPRETEVAALIAAGYTDAEIGRALGIGRRTAETHAGNVLGKLGLRSRRELMRKPPRA